MSERGAKRKRNQGEGIANQGEIFEQVKALLDIFIAQTEREAPLTMKRRITKISYLVIAYLLGIAYQSVFAAPPFSGTTFIDPDIITPTDRSAFESATYAGQGFRTMFDRRVNNWINVNAFLFNVVFDDSLTSEIQVNSEFGSSDAALVEAEKYGWVIGQLPASSRSAWRGGWSSQRACP